VVANAFDPAIVRDDPATVAVDQAADEVFGRLVDKGLLPGFETDRPFVLLAGAMLWKDAWPVLGTEHDLNASAFFPHDGRALTWHE